ncbi:hypothetical protein DXG01_012385 [Tephrocybe rancida]|nr:hypothetical protein DXG01_012385 [Tephrocybe rancida]
MTTPTAGSSISACADLKASSDRYLNERRMLDDPKNAPSITWTELGTSFVVFDVDIFNHTTLRSHSALKSFPRFMQQLNLLNFYMIYRVSPCPITPTRNTQPRSHVDSTRGAKVRAR